jgi:hypothetical protein
VANHQFKVGDYVLVVYPTRPPHKLSPIYRGPMKIVKKARDDIFELRDLITEKNIPFHVDRLRIFNKEVNITEEDLKELAAADKDEFVVEAIVGHRGTLNKRSSMEFRVRWQGYDESEDTWLPLREVKDLVALDQYQMLNPELTHL